MKKNGIFNKNWDIRILWKLGNLIGKLGKK